MMTYHAKITSKGQITLPIDARRALGMKDGDTLTVDVEVDGLKLKPLRSTRDLIGIGRPYIRRKGPLDLPWSEVRQIAEDYAAEEFRRTKVGNR